MVNYTQEQMFVFFFIIGLILGIIFDIFRVLRKNIRTPDFVTFLEDIIYIIISFTLLVLAIIKINNGIIRLYLFIGIFLGITAYSLTISNLCVIILSVIVRFCIFLLQKIQKYIILITKHIKTVIKKVL